VLNSVNLGFRKVVVLSFHHLVQFFGTVVTRCRWMQSRFKKSFIRRRREEGFGGFGASGGRALKDASEETQVVLRGGEQPGPTTISISTAET
jgi:hypothetical protein